MANLFFASIQSSWFDIRMESSMLLAEAELSGWELFFLKAGLGFVLVVTLLAGLLDDTDTGGSSRRETRSCSDESYSSNDYEPYTPREQWSEDQGCGWGNTRREDFGHGP